MGKDFDGEDDHFGSGAERQHRKRQGQDSGQGRNSAGSAASHFRRKAARGWTHSLRLQHPKGIHAPSRPEAQRWNHRALSQNVGAEIQLREDDLPQVLRSLASSRHQLPQEELRSYQQPPPQEEAQVNVDDSTVEVLGSFHVDSFHVDSELFYSSHSQSLKRIRKQ